LECSLSDCAPEVLAREELPDLEPLGLSVALRHSATLAGVAALVRRAAYAVKGDLISTEVWHVPAGGVR
jgi:hypothetical protein